MVRTRTKALRAKGRLGRTDMSPPISTKLRISLSRPGRQNWPRVQSCIRPVAWPLTSTPSVALWGHSPTGPAHVGMGTQRRSGQDGPSPRERCLGVPSSEAAPLQERQLVGTQAQQVRSQHGAEVLGFLPAQPGRALPGTTVPFPTRGDRLEPLHPPCSCAQARPSRVLSTSAHTHP